MLSHICPLLEAAVLFPKHRAGERLLSIRVGVDIDPLKSIIRASSRIPLHVNSILKLPKLSFKNLLMWVTQAARSQWLIINTKRPGEESLWIIVASMHESGSPVCCGSEKGSEKGIMHHAGASRWVLVICFLWLYLLFRCERLLNKAVNWFSCSH